MKSSVFFPILILTAAGAFGLGWAVRPGGADVPAKAAAQGSKGARTPVVRSSSGGGGAGKALMRPETEFVERFRSSGGISEDDMATAVAEMMKVNDPILRRKLFAALLDELTPENAKAAWIALRENRRGGFPGRGGMEDELRLLANAWGRLDGPGAIKALTEMRAEREAQREGDGRGRGGGDRGPGELISVLSGWATVDGDAAAAYLDGIEDQGQQRMAAFGVLQGMLVNGVDEAMAFVSSLPKSEDGNRAQSFYMAIVANEMLEQGMDTAKSWVDTISDPDLRTGALSRVADEMVRDDLDSAVEWVTQYADEESAARAVSRVASEWAEDDPQAVLAWAADLPDASRALAYEQALDEWTERDPVAAGEYLTNMAPSPERDSAVEGFATELAREDAATAMQWAETIASEDLRQQTVLEVAQRWYRTDRTAATAWIEASGLPAESVESIKEAPRFDGPGRGGRGPGRGRGR
ncbi:MAG: hypothetical protein HKN82_07470 [Akkermansiaceae bacterium]|nr:hypothetical protein [Akkermansiaceae bacterium]NNM29411.1 hypothetical protein [Akkermansiaceae bacterium]